MKRKYTFNTKLKNSINSVNKKHTQAKIDKNKQSQQNKIKKNTYTH